MACIAQVRPILTSKIRVDQCRGLTEEQGRYDEDKGTIGALEAVHEALAAI